MGGTGGGGGGIHRWSNQRPEKQKETSPSTIAMSIRGPLHRDMWRTLASQVSYDECREE
jgi:hypothetical protein